MSDTTLSCSRCDSELEECACCNEPGCPTPICYGCLNLALSPEAPPRAPKQTEPAASA